MREVVIDKSFLNIPSDATVKLYECNKYGNPINLISIDITSESTIVPVNCDTKTLKSSTSDILAKYALYMLEITFNKKIQKIPLFIFDGIGQLATEDLLSPVNYESIFNVLAYTGEELPVILQDCIEKLDIWFSSENKNIFPQGYRALIETYVLYADHFSSNEEYMSAQCLRDFDAILANYTKES